MSAPSLVANTSRLSSNRRRERPVVPGSVPDQHDHTPPGSARQQFRACLQWPDCLYRVYTGTDTSGRVDLLSMG